jgi:hypothetical protein
MTCRNNTGVACDREETCDGLSTTCPDDTGSSCIINGVVFCQPDEYEVTPANATHERVCAKASVCNSTTEYESRALSATADRLCNSLRVCNTSTEWEKLPPTTTSNRICQLVSACNYSSEWMPRDATATSDRICLELTRCNSTQIESLPPTRTTDRVCVDPSQAPTVPVAGSSGGSMLIIIIVIILILIILLLLAIVYRRMRRDPRQPANTVGGKEHEAIMFTNPAFTGPGGGEGGKTSWAEESRGHTNALYAETAFDDGDNLVGGAAIFDHEKEKLGGNAKNPLYGGNVEGDYDEIPGDMENAYAEMGPGGTREGLENPAYADAADASRIGLENAAYGATGAASRSGLENPAYGDAAARGLNNPAYETRDARSGLDNANYESSEVQGRRAMSNAAYGQQRGEASLYDDLPQPEAACSNAYLDVAPDGLPGAVAADDDDYADLAAFGEVQAEDSYMDLGEDFGEDNGNDVKAIESGETRKTEPYSDLDPNHKRHESYSKLESNKSSAAGAPYEEVSGGAKAEAEAGPPAGPVSAKERRKQQRAAKAAAAKEKKGGKKKKSKSSNEVTPIPAGAAGDAYFEPADASAGGQDAYCDVDAADAGEQGDYATVEAAGGANPKDAYMETAGGVSNPTYITAGTAETSADAGYMETRQAGSSSAYFDPAPKPTGVDDGDNYATVEASKGPVAMYAEGPGISTPASASYMAVNTQPQPGTGGEYMTTAGNLTGQDVYADVSAADE